MKRNTTSNEQGWDDCVDNDWLSSTTEPRPSYHWDFESRPTREHKQEESVGQRLDTAATEFKLYMYDGFI